MDAYAQKLSTETPYGPLMPAEIVPDGYAEIVALYGEPTSPRFIHRLVLMSFPYPLLYLDAHVTHGMVHGLVAPNLWAALSLLRDRGLSTEFERYAGCYCYRPKRGFQTRLSLHAFGAAIDGDAIRYPLGSTARYSDGVVECFATYGFSYGGDFTARPDPMHFQLAKGY